MLRQDPAPVRRGTSQLPLIPLQCTQTPFSHVGLTTLIQRAAELRGILMHGECLSFLTLGDRIWTLATACGNERVTTVIEVPLRGGRAPNQPKAAFGSPRYPGIRTHVFFHVDPQSGTDNTLISCAQ